MSKLLYKVNSLTKIFGKDQNCVTALKSVDLEIFEGDFIAITGLSGSGKTTFLNILAGLIPATDGQVLLDNENILKWNDKQLSGYRNLSLGYVMQNFGLINTLNVLNNVLLPIKKNKRKYKNIAIEKLSILKIDSKTKALPYQLSGGQKQRVAIARALINNPKVILADEPTGALDSENSQNIIDILKQINDSGTTIILVTHEESIARQCKKVIKFQDGKIVDIKIM